MAASAVAPWPSFEARPRGRAPQDDGGGVVIMSVAIRQQRGVAAGGSGIDGDGLFGCEPREIMRAAGLWAGARQAMSAERLYADHGADHVAVDIDVADRQPVDHRLDG